MWAKGNLHTHTNVSDGDTAPREVCQYYVDHGYHFLAITDHMARVDASKFDDIPLLLIPSEEMHNKAEEAPHSHQHVNGFGLSETLTVSPAPTKASAIQSCIDQIVEDGGIAQINHPNFFYSFDHNIIAQTKNCHLLEIFNGHPLVHNQGDNDHLAVEAMWDRLLSQGYRYYGTAVDDAHHFQGEFAPHRANPSRGWIYAKVDKLAVENILSALRTGDFYASTGVELDKLTIEDDTLHISIRKTDGMSYLTEYISNGGKVLHSTEALISSFKLPEDEAYTYVRARVTAYNGKTAWTQPLFRD